MPWYQVRIENNDVADMSASHLMQSFKTSYRDAGAPVGASIFVGKTATEDRVYYFSSQASLLAAKLLSEFGATACSEAPDLSGLKKIDL